jgi:hypothetical protein
MCSWLRPDKGYKENMIFNEIDKLLVDLAIDENTKKEIYQILYIHIISC